MLALTRTIRLHPVQAAFRRSRALYRAFVGGRGAGKSWVGAYDLIRRARRDRLYLVAAPTYPMLADATFRTFCAVGRDLGVIRLGDVKKSPPSVRLTTGAEVLFRSADDPERLRGPNLTGVWLDEASLLHQDAYNIAIACLREQGEQGWLSATFTPKGLSHWTYEYFGQPRPDTELFRARTDQNPFNPPDFAETIRQQYGERLARQELGGEFCDAEGVEWPGSYFGPSIWFHEHPRFIAQVLALDPAQGKGEKGCYVTYVHVGLDEHNILWVDAWMDQGWDAVQMVEQGVELCRRMNPGLFSVEVSGQQGFLLPLFGSVAAREKLVLPLHSFDPSPQNKEVRIRELGPWLAQGRIRFRDEQRGTRLLVQQLRDFPVGEFMDGPDALQQALVGLRVLLEGRGARGPTRVRA